MRRIGLFGGTFDPIHIGHLVAAEFVLEACELEQVVFVPTRVPPHKEAPDTPAEDRFRMVELAVADRPGLAVSRVELDRQGPSYTVDTLRHLSARRPGVRFAWILGADQLLGFPMWKSPEEIVSFADLIVVVRPGYNEHKGMDAVRDRFPKATLEMVEMPRLDVSSSELRARLAAGRTVSALVPRAVQEYIRDRGLYERTGQPK
ncbi:MAG: nicotinate-nucleotide adenylyltransferase [Kyrpidia sp.]|nr:nicotinate-nucleotide adenylyltransferase [Kyrpidia sp.]